MVNRHKRWVRAKTRARSRTLVKRSGWGIFAKGKLAIYEKSLHLNWWKWIEFFWVTIHPQKNLAEGSLNRCRLLICVIVNAKWPNSWFAEISCTPNSDLKTEPLIWKHTEYWLKNIQTVFIFQKKFEADLVKVEEKIGKTREQLDEIGPRYIQVRTKEEQAAKE